MGAGARWTVEDGRGREGEDDDGVTEDAPPTIGSRLGKRIRQIKCRESPNAIVNKMTESNFILPSRASVASSELWPDGRIRGGDDGAENLDLHRLSNF